MADNLSDASSICHSPGWERYKKPRQKQMEESKKTRQKTTLGREYEQSKPSKLTKTRPYESLKMFPTSSHPGRGDRSRRGSLDSGIRNLLNIIQPAPKPPRPCQTASGIVGTSILDRGFIGGLKLKLADEAACLQQRRGSIHMGGSSHDIKRTSEGNEIQISTRIIDRKSTSPTALDAGSSHDVTQGKCIDCKHVPCDGTVSGKSIIPPQIEVKCDHVQDQPITERRKKRSARETSYPRSGDSVSFQSMITIGDNRPAEGELTEKFKGHNEPFVQVANLPLGTFHAQDFSARNNWLLQEEDGYIKTLNKGELATDRERSPVNNTNLIYRDRITTDTSRANNHLTMSGSVGGLQTTKIPNPSNTTLPLPNAQFGSFTKVHSGLPCDGFHKPNRGTIIPGKTEGTSEMGNITRTSLSPPSGGGINISLHPLSMHSNDKPPRAMELDIQNPASSINRNGIGRDYSLKSNSTTLPSSYPSNAGFSLRRGQRQANIGERKERSLVETTNTPEYHNENSGYSSGSLSATLGDIKVNADLSYEAYHRGTKVPRDLNTIARIFVVCCSCHHFLDMPSKIYRYLSNTSRTVADERLGVSGEIMTVVKCPWCSHGVSKECCAEYMTTIHFHEKLN
ncbi:hypothetical protein F5884DRAFT_899435 [Xylogone sp. PMI_703]|nr:hypothetical protein F5884DRAFT_899435 [Xylogone sp. PMI_703]